MNPDETEPVDPPAAPLEAPDEGDDATAPQPEAEGGALDVPIVGIGASAGGLAAFEAFFAGMPTDVEPGMAFVLVQHLAPDHKSILTSLIQRCTRMRVFEVEDGMRVEPNCAYIIPPNRDMALLNGAPPGAGAAGPSWDRRRQQRRAAVAAAARPCGGGADRRRGIGRPPQ